MLLQGVPNFVSHNGSWVCSKFNCVLLCNYKRGAHFVHFDHCILVRGLQFPVCTDSIHVKVLYKFVKKKCRPVKIFKYFESLGIVLHALIL